MLPSDLETTNGWSCERHGRDLWFLAAGEVMACVRFPNPRLADAADASAILAADDPVALVRARWLGGSASDRGRIVCAQCSKLLEYWDGARTLGVDCATRFAKPSVGELSEWSAKWAERWTRVPEWERTTQQAFSGRPEDHHEQVRDREQHAQEQARLEQQAKAQRLKQEQRSWADYWTPERARQAQARARERARQDKSHTD